jgi:hypothetical protein
LRRGFEICLIDPNILFSLRIDGPSSLKVQSP